MFKRNKLTSAMLTVMAGSAVVSSGAFAQGEEELIVTGIRASLQSSMDTKRDSAGVVDAITSEDIGKFPDSNLAESLQRITGVSIDRRNGEGFQVTVRGFGPQFNLVTLNGRSMPSSQLGVRGGLVSNRSFDMSNIASEGVSGVEVYKTGKANVSSGGIGATINLKTLRPFDNAGFKASVGAKALMDTTNRVGEDITPELSGFASWSNDMFGASLSLSHQERDSAASGVFTNNWSDYSGGWTGPDFFEGDSSAATVTNAPAMGQQTNATPGIRYHHGDYERTRDNGQLTLQFRPIENLTATLDHTIAEQESYVNSAELSFWFGGGAFPATDVVMDGNSQVSTPVYFWTENPSGEVRDIGITQNQGHVQNNLESTGLNVEFVVNDALTLTLDAHNSTSESLPADGAMSNQFNIGLGAQGMYAQGYDNSGDLPLLVGAYRDDHRDGSGSLGNRAHALDVADVGSTVRQINHDRSWAELNQVQLGGRFEFDNGAIDFGVESRSMEATQRSSFSQIVLEGNWGVGTPGDVPANMVEELNFADLFDGYRTTLDSDAQAFFNGAGNADPYGSGTTGSNADVALTGYIAYDVGALGELLSANANLDWAPAPNDGTNRTIKEDITSAFAQVAMEGQLGTMDFNVLAGIRYEASEVESIGQVAPSTLQWQGDNDFASNSGDASTAPIISGKATYDHMLPSLDFSLNITDDLIGRVSMGKTIARADYNNLQEGVTGVQPPRGGPTILGANPGDASNGNVGLRPIESNNFDISLEWYFDDASYASVGYFDKRVPNFIGTAVTTEEAEGVLDPSNGPRAEAAIAELESRSIEVNQQSLFTMIASMNLDPAGCQERFGTGEDATNSASCGADYDAYGYEGTDGWEDNVDLIAVSSGAYADPTSINRVRRPVNSQDARLNGWEFAVQHFFGETGFGVQANYTIVNGSIGYDIEASPTDTQFALTGLSDSANLTLIYENHGLSARLAYNWRDEFLVSPAAASNEPQFTEAYAQLDFSVGYEVTDNFSVALEGLNILEEDTRSFARTNRQLTRLDILGARYALSARYTF